VELTKAFESAALAQAAAARDISMKRGHQGGQSFSLCLPAVLCRWVKLHRLLLSGAASGGGGGWSNGDFSGVEQYHVLVVLQQVVWGPPLSRKKKCIRLDTSQFIRFIPGVSDPPPLAAKSGERRTPPLLCNARNLRGGTFEKPNKRHVNCTDCICVVLVLILRTFPDLLPR
jgi:hypothetical protein